MGTSKSKECIAVYVDLEKAFELTHPLVVLHEANKLGIKSNVQAYIIDYLRDRKFQGNKSQVRDFDLGTPQGSCISPFLLNIVMNRLISKDPDDICTLDYTNGVQIVSYAGINSIRIMWTLGKRNGENALNVFVKEYDGQVLIHLRHYSKAAGGDRWYPTKKGVTLNFV